MEELGLRHAEEFGEGDERPVDRARSQALEAAEEGEYGQEHDHVEPPPQSQCGAGVQVGRAQQKRPELHGD